MLISFQTTCRTLFGEMLYLLVDGEPPLQMTYDADFVWKGDITFKKTLLSYHYKLINEAGTTIFEDRQRRVVAISTDVTDLLIIDELDKSNLTTIFQTTPFTEAIFAHPVEPAAKIKSGQWVFEVLAPTVLPTQQVAITGSVEALGNWERTLPLKYIGDGIWMIQFSKEKLPEYFEYKFVTIDSITKKIRKWEQGDNRRIDMNSNEKYTNSHIVKSNFHDNYLFRGAGVAIPVFSLRSKQSCGVGDFYDLKLMVDWAVVTGQQLIQLLPINDTTRTKTNSDSYPYSSISVCAIHPIYMRLEALPPLKDKVFLQSYQQRKKELNKSYYVDYQSVVKLKDDYLKKLYNQEWKSTVAKQSYQQFVYQNSDWLLPYAVFSVLRDKFKTADFHTWNEFAVYDAKKVAQFADDNSKTVGFYYFVQYHLAMQLKEAREYAHSKGVALKGDLPIGISRHSVDAWMKPHLFHLDMQAGAPPDDFSAKGQNWGFPTYNWEKMAKDGFQWWKNRFRNMANYFDAYRIDHILGFFRIWQIPTGAVWGLLGTFSPALPLSRSEIESYGIAFDNERYLHPYITDDVLTELCGNDKGWIMKFLNVRQYGIYQFKPEFNTQQKIHNFFATHRRLERYHERYDILMRLHTEVLFIRDTKQKECFHSRISLQKTLLFKTLDKNTQAALNRLYEDFFYRRHNDFWKQQALNKLPALLEATKMLVCGEDLGMVPNSVPEVMAQLQILSLEIQRMPKEFGVEFIDPHATPYLSVNSTGSHDMSTLRGWWREDKEKIQCYFNQMLHREGVAPDDCTSDLALQIITQQMEANSMWTILPLQDYLAISDELKSPDVEGERINNPANPNHFWCYRMHLCLEDLIKADALNEKLRAIIVEHRN